MKNYIIAGILLLFLSAASLFLPSFVMEWQDEQMTEKSQVEEVQEVVLKEQVSMTLPEKLKLREQDTVNALNLVNGKNYNQDTIDEQVRKEIGILAEQGLLLDFDLEPLKVTEAIIYFYVDMEDSERSIMMWEISAETLGNTLNLFLDDETGKIVSFSQYSYESYKTSRSIGNAVEEYDGQSNGASVSMYSVEPEIEIEEMQELAERWGDYLGCKVIESRSSQIGLYNLYFGTNAEEFLRLVERMMQKGYTEAEAEEKVAMEWGVEITGKQVYATLEDEGDQIGYILWLENSAFHIDPVVE